ncbi:MAG: amidase domain-containing protein, partial [Clostridia bacterium]|nr:amidase domain-containing protein [Clostridia bacterium]
DCTNFISQCLLFGGYEMNFNNYGWFYDSPSNRAPAWTGVDEFFNFSTKNNTNYGPKAKLATISDMQVGDIIQLLQNGQNFHHTLIITQILGEPNLDNIFVACHTKDAYNKRLSDYNFKKIRFLKLF